MRTAQVKFNYNDGKGIQAAAAYIEKLQSYGFIYSYTAREGGKVYHHYDMGLDVLVYVE